MTQPEKIQYILKGGCDFFGMTMDDLQKKTGSRSKIWDKKRFLIPVLNDNTVCNINDIANLLGYKSHASVLYHKNTINEELSGEIYGSEKTKKVYNEFLQYLKL